MRVRSCFAVLFLWTVWYAEAAVAAEDVDIVFLLDSSGSITRVDPQEYRTVLVKALAAFVRDSGGDRLGIVQFAGWNEVLAPVEGEPRKLVVFPLAGIPAVPTEKMEFARGVSSAVDELAIFGTATDINLAMAGLGAATGLFTVGAGGTALAEGARAYPRSVWAIIISDGDVDPVGAGVGVWDKYVALARATGGEERVGRNEIKKAAQAFFDDSVWPEVSKLKVRITPISLDPGSPAAADFLQKLASGCGLPGSIVDTRGSALKDVFMPLVQLRPGLVEGEIQAYGYEKAVLAPGAGHERKVHIMPGTKRTQVVVFAGLPPESEIAEKAKAATLEAARAGTEAPRPRLNFSATIENRGGVEGFEQTMVSTFGEGDRYRVISIANAPEGVYWVSLKNASGFSGKPCELYLESALFTEFKMRVEIIIKNEAPAYKFGEAIQFEIIGLDEKGKAISDAEMISTISGTVTVIAPTGDKSAQPLMFEGLTEARLPWGYTFKAQTGAGGYEFEFEILASAQGAVTERQKVMARETVGRKVLVLPAIPVALSIRSGFVGQKIELIGHSEKIVGLPDQLESGVTDIEGKIRPVTIAWDEERGAYVGLVCFDRPGRYSVARTAPEGKVLLQEGTPSEIDVRERELHVFIGGREIESLDWAVGYAESRDYSKPPKEEDKFQAFFKKVGQAVGIWKEQELGKPKQVELRVDLVEGESASVEVAFEAGKEAPSGAVVLSLDPAEGKVAPEGSPFKLNINVKSEESLPEKPGEAVFTAEVAGKKVVRTIPIKAAYPDKWVKLLAKWWWALAAALVLLVILLLWVTTPKFATQELRPISAVPGPPVIHKLKEIGSRRKAKISPECPKGAVIRLFGRRGIWSVTPRVGPGAEPAVMLSVRGEKTSRWTDVKHGDEIRLELPSGEYFRYWYFDRPPSEEELQRMLDADAVALQADEVIIEW